MSFILSLNNLSNINLLSILCVFDSVLSVPITLTIANRTVDFMKSSRAEDVRTENILKSRLDIYVQLAKTLFKIIQRTHHLFIKDSLHLRMIQIDIERKDALYELLYYVVVDKFYVCAFLFRKTSRCEKVSIMQIVLDIVKFDQAR